MANFTEEIKNEIIKNFHAESRTCFAALSAFIRTSGSLLTENGVWGFELATENQASAHFFAEITEFCGYSLTDFKSSSAVGSGKDKLTFKCVNGGSEDFLKKLGIISVNGNEEFIDFSINPSLIETEEGRAAYICGAFLGGGSCTLPELITANHTGYHFEVVYRNKFTAQDFCNLLCSYDILPKLVKRKDFYVVYLKSRDAIAAVLSVMGTAECAAKLNALSRQKEETNNLNRVSNCSVSNIDKAVTASVKQVQAIEIISSTIGLTSLDEMLFSVAESRLADKNASMQELADRLNITKSCINHRMRKIIDIAQTLSQD